MLRYGTIAQNVKVDWLGMNKIFYCGLFVVCGVTVTSSLGYAADSGGDSVVQEEVKKPSRDDVIYRVNLGRADDVAILLKRGASADMVNDAGTPIISLATSRFDKEGLAVVKLLVESGADINKGDVRGQTALFYAARMGNKEMVEYLLSSNINYSATDNLGNNARIIAYQTGHNEIVELLDNFVRKQNEMSRAKQEEVNKQLAEYYKAYNDAVKAQNQQNATAASTATSAPAVELPALPTVVEMESKSAKMKELVYKVSFESCTSAYWQFCRSVKQPTEFNEQYLSSAIERNGKNINTLGGELNNVYGVKADVIQNIITSTGDKVKNQLTALSTNEFRRDAGVGSMEDMNKRCIPIAKSWNSVVDEHIKNNPVNEKSKPAFMMWGGRNKPQPQGQPSQ